MLPDPRATLRRGTTVPLSVAPMMDVTDRHFRAFLRLLTRHALLYTEMLTTWAVLEGDRERLLAFSPAEHPIALQLGGDDPGKLAACARIAADLGYDEVNLNVGCPSSRVSEGSFGACLMGRPERVAEAVSAMRAAVALPVTVKHRIGIDDLDRYEDLARFVDTVAAAGCDRFSVHARKAWLSGLSPKENRTVPPLRYDDVYRLKAERPELAIELNGGVTDLEQAAAHLERVDAVMIGRAAQSDPYLLAAVDRRFFDPGAPPPPSRADAVRAFLPHVERWTARGVPFQVVTRGILNLFNGIPGARAWRRELTLGARQPGAGAAVVEAALATVEGRMAARSR